MKEIAFFSKFCQNCWFLPICLKNKLVSLFLKNIGTVLPFQKSINFPILLPGSENMPTWMPKIGIFPFFCDKKMRNVSFWMLKNCVTLSYAKSNSKSNYSSSRNSWACEDRTKNECATALFVWQHVMKILHVGYE